MPFREQRETDALNAAVGARVNWLRSVPIERRQQIEELEAAGSHASDPPR
jgi:hypothetical protein